jgi:hypothetical protein
MLLSFQGTVSTIRWPKLEQCVIVNKVSRFGSSLWETAGKTLFRQ